MAEQNAKALLDLTLEVARLEEQERAAEATWKALQRQKEAKFAHLRELMRGADGNGKFAPAEVNPVKTAKPLGASQRVLRFLNSNTDREYSTAELASQVGAPPNSMSMYLGQLVKQGAIVRVALGKYKAATQGA